MRLARERFQREKASFAGLAAGPGRSLCAFFAEGIPLATGLALALPATESGTTVLADKGQVSFRHSGNRQKEWSRHAKAPMRTIQEHF